MPKVILDQPQVVAAVPSVGSSSPARIRISVVFPAPSGPTKPVTAPEWTSASISSKAPRPVGTNLFIRPRIRTNASSLIFSGLIGIGIEKFYGNRRSLAQIPIRILDNYSKAKNQIRSQFARLDCFWGKLGDR